MCPNISNSCCSLEDEAAMFSQFSTVSQSMFTEFLLKNQAIMNEFYDQIVKATEFAAVVKKNNIRKLGNCKLLAERIVNYHTADIVEQLKANYERLTNYYKQFYTSFYCIICNHDYHRFFNIKKQTVQFSNKACRDHVENNLANLLFVLVNVRRLQKMILRLVTSCDFLGDYTLDEKYPLYLDVQENKDLEALQQDVL